MEIVSSKVGVRWNGRLGKMKALDAKSVRNWLLVCERIADLLERAGALLEPELSTEEIADSWDQALSLSSFARGEVKSARMTMVPVDCPLESLKPMRAIYADFMRLGNLALAVSATSRARPKRKGANVEWSFGKFSFRDARIIASRQDYDQFVSEIRAPDNTLVFLAQQLLWDDSGHEPSRAA